MRGCARADRLTTHFLRVALVLAAIGLVGAAATHAAEGRFAAAAFVGAYLVWLLSEGRITTGVPSQSAAEHRTLVPYAAARIATALVAAYAAPAVPGRVGLVLVGVFLAGVVLRAWAIHELGAAYSHRVAPIPGGRPVSSGPYRVLRHPAYAGMLLANLGFVGYFATPAGVAALALLVAAVLWRIRVEEDVLTRSSEYLEFARDRRRIVPGVW
jgi:protein-S-isoprenylcysteine O-methyltransferase Ste14